MYPVTYKARQLSLWICSDSVFSCITFLSFKIICMYPTSNLISSNHNSCQSQDCYTKMPVLSTVSLTKCLEICVYLQAEFRIRPPKPFLISIIVQTVARSMPICLVIGLHFSTTFNGPGPIILCWGCVLCWMFRVVHSPCNPNLQTQTIEFIAFAQTAFITRLHASLRYNFVKMK